VARFGKKSREKAPPSKTEDGAPGSFSFYVKDEPGSVEIDLVDM